MADRTVSDRVRAEIAQYQAAMAQATASTKGLANEVTTASRTGDKGFKMLGTVSTVAAVGMAAGFGKMVTTAASFEKQMSGVKAVSGASADEMNRLEKAALAAGASTDLAGVSASDAARAQAELVKAGVSVNDVLSGGLIGSLSLASAGQLDFGKAAEISAQAMNIFNLEGSQVGHIADVMAASANKSAADVAGLGDALRMGGLMAEQTGLTLEDTVGVFSAFADNALVGSDAGTSLKVMLQRLAPSSEEAANMMKQLGFDAYDAQGAFIGTEALAGELADSFGHLSQERRNEALSTIFGSDALRAANVLIDEGAAGVRDYITAVDDQGAATRMAAEQTNNLSGDIDALGGALESAMIENGSVITGSLRGVTQGLTDLVTGFSNLPPAAQSGLLGLGTAVVTLGTGLFVVVPRIVKAHDALKAMQTDMPRLTGALGGLAKAAGGVAVAFGAFQAVEAFEKSRIDRAEIGALTGSLLDLGESGRITGELLRITGEDFEDLGRKIEIAGNSPWSIFDSAGRAEVNEANALIDDLDKSLASLFQRDPSQARARWDEITAAAEAQGVSIGTTRDRFNDYVAAVAEADVTQRTATAGADGLAGATEALAGDVEGLGGALATTEEEINAFRDALDAVLGASFGVEEATDALETQILNLRSSFELGADGVAGNTTSLDANTEAGLANREALRGLVEGAAGVIQAQAEQGASSEQLQATLVWQKTRLEEVLTQLGYNREEVGRYVGVLDLVPTEVGSNVQLTGVDAAVAGADRVAAAVRRIGTTVASMSGRVDVRFANSNVIANANGNLYENHVAQIAPAGAMRLWAEDETAGETYIPLAPARSAA